MALATLLHSYPRATAHLTDLMEVQVCRRRVDSFAVFILVEIMNDSSNNAKISHFVCVGRVSKQVDPISPRPGCKHQDVHISQDPPNEPRPPQRPSARPLNKLLHSVLNEHCARLQEEGLECAKARVVEGHIVARDVVEAGESKDDEGACLFGEEGGAREVEDAVSEEVCMDCEDLHRWSV